MSYGIIRVAKFNSAAVRGIQIHDEREKGKSHSNPDIDFNRTKDNYSLKERSGKIYNQIIKERIESLELKKAVRKDAVVMCSFVVTSDKDFFNSISLEREKEYFQKAYNFIKERYGEENIISAEVHKDETTPHLHINFVPVTQDNRLSAKSLFNKISLKKLQDDFHQQVSLQFGLERGGDGEHQKNIDKVTYKRQKVKNELNEIEQIEKETAEKKEVVLQRAMNIQKLHSYNSMDLTEEDIKKQSLFDTKKDIVERLNQKLRPMLEHSKLAIVIKKEFDKLKKSYDDLKEQFKQVTDELSKYKELFQGLKPEQEKEIKLISLRMKRENKKEQELIEKEVLKKEKDRNSKSWSR